MKLTNKFCKIFFIYIFILVLTQQSAYSQQITVKSSTSSTTNGVVATGSTSNSAPAENLDFAEGSNTCIKSIGESQEQLRTDMAETMTEAVYIGIPKSEKKVSAYSCLSDILPSFSDFGSIADMARAAALSAFKKAKEIACDTTSGAVSGVTETVNGVGSGAIQGMSDALTAATNAYLTGAADAMTVGLQGNLEMLEDSTKADSIKGGLVDKGMGQVDGLTGSLGLPSFADDFMDSQKEEIENSLYDLGT